MNLQFSEKIKQFRLKKGVTQGELAIKTGLSRNTIVNYETGRRVPRADDLLRVAKALEIDPTCFFDSRPYSLFSQDTKESCVDEWQGNIAGAIRLVSRFIYQLDQLHTTCDEAKEITGITLDVAEDGKISTGSALRKQYFEAKEAFLGIENLMSS